MRRKHVPEKMLIWLLIHGGDPVPGELSAVDQLLLFQALHDLAALLPNADLRKEIEGVTSKALVSIAQEMAREAGGKLVRAKA